jgi:hypothetical protein
MKHIHGPTSRPAVKPAEPLVWKKRAQTDHTITGPRHIWATRCGRYRVVFSQPVFHVPAIYYAQRWIRCAGNPDKFFWDNISKHRKKEPAFEACEKEHKKHG